ncbi:MAG TPA: tripartite tricarboxylate transporter substrate binding protein [Burkholderiales bacterium]|jgi:tripartite-type tricarboxylate transporter receptor subunit TctC|nr:tripartite tricarboxylate transporter substrate binding protein [Burkholderiales bacterium]
MSSLVRFTLSLVCVSFTGIGCAAAAEVYPARSVRWIVPYPPAGTTDILARIMAQRLTERLGHQVVVDNRPGAANNIGTELVVKAAPDGYTVLLVNPANAINATLYPNLSFNFLRDLAPVAGLVRVPNVMEVTVSLPAKTVAEFIAYAKANPGKVILASSGSGTSVHLSGELFKSMTGVDLTHVPYKGAGPALIDLIGGQTHVMFDNLPSSIEYIKAGKLRALGVTTQKRSAALPDVPTVADTVPGYEASAWFGMAAPRGTPVEIVNRLNREINDTLAEPKIKARLAELGGDSIAGSPADFWKLHTMETEKWAKVVKSSGAKVE